MSSSNPSIAGSVLVLVVIACCACDQLAPTYVTPPPRDAGADAESISTSDADSEDGPVTLVDLGAEDVDGGASGGRDSWAPLSLGNSDLWNQREPCEGTVAAERASDEAFSIPNNPSFPDFNRTRSRYVAEFGEPSSDAWSLVAAHRHNSHEFPYDLWANSGDDVVLRWFNMGRTTAQHPGLASIITVLVNYEPVEATFEYLSPDLADVLDSSVGAGTRRVLDSDYQVLQITIPASEFVSGASNEIAVANIEHSKDFTVALSRRLTVHYGGYELPPPTPCNPRPLKAYRTYDEYRLAFLMRYSQTAIFLNPQPYIINIHEEIAAQPGQTVTVYYSKFHYGKPPGFSDPIRVAMIPTLNGEPIAETIWSMESGDIEENVTGFDIIDDRGTFEVTLPDGPGVYDVALMTWAYPFVRWREIDGTPRLGYEGVRVSRIPANSNVLRFRVK